MNNDSFNNTDGGFVRPNNIIKFAGGFMNNQILESQGTEANGMQDAEVSPEVQENINLVSLFGSQKDDSQAKAMTLLANQTAAFFHTPDLEAYATINEGGIQKNIRVRSKTAELWLSRLIDMKTISQ